MKKTHTPQETLTASLRATYQDVLDAPAQMVAEIVDGKLHTQSRPAWPHAKASSRLGNNLGPPFDFGRGGPGGWRIIDEPEIHLGEDIVVPDLAGWRRERMPVEPTEAYVTLSPDWVCEVLSPSTQEFDRGAKSKVYARERTSHMWFVDPIARFLEAFELRGTEWELIDMLFDNAQVSLPPFEAISFNLGDLWLEPVVHRETPTTEFEPELIETSK